MGLYYSKNKQTFLKMSSEEQINIYKTEIQNIKNIDEFYNFIISEREYEINPVVEGIINLDTHINLERGVKQYVFYAYCKFILQKYNEIKHDKPKNNEEEDYIKHYINIVKMNIDDMNETIENCNKL